MDDSPCIWMIRLVRWLVRSNISTKNSSVVSASAMAIAAGRGADVTSSLYDGLVALTLLADPRALTRIPVPAVILVAADAADVLSNVNGATATSWDEAPASAAQDVDVGGSVAARVIAAGVALSITADVATVPIPTTPCVDSAATSVTPCDDSDVKSPIDAGPTSSQPTLPAAEPG